jgi:hypothetical protein
MIKDNSRQRNTDPSVAEAICEIVFKKHHQYHIKSHQKSC